jgi:hypothetical protein
MLEVLASRRHLNELEAFVTRSEISQPRSKSMLGRSCLSQLLARNSKARRLSLTAHRGEVLVRPKLRRDVGSWNASRSANVDADRFSLQRLLGQLWPRGTSTPASLLANDVGPDFRKDPPMCDIVAAKAQLRRLRRVSRQWHILGKGGTSLGAIGHRPR